MAERPSVQISPELCLVDPELAAWARLRGDDHPRYSRPEIPTAVAAPRGRRRRGLVVPLALTAFGVSLAFNVLTLTHRHGSLETHAAAAGRTELAWRPVDGAHGYDVILWRGGERVLDLWPKAAHVTLPARWRHRGTLLTPRSGRMLWFVYPLLSRTSKPTFGPLVASGRLEA